MPQQQQQQPQHPAASMEYASAEECEEDLPPPRAVRRRISPMPVTLPPLSSDLSSDVTVHDQLVNAPPVQQEEQEEQEEAARRAARMLVRRHTPRLANLCDQVSHQHATATAQLLAGSSHVQEGARACLVPTTQVWIQACEQIQEDDSVAPDASPLRHDHLCIDALVMHQTDKTWIDVQHEDCDKRSDRSADWDSDDYNFVAWPDSREPDTLLSDAEEQEREDAVEEAPPDVARCLNHPCPRPAHRWASRHGRCDACYRYLAKYGKDHDLA